MGILTLQRDGRYVISSDRSITDAPVSRPPKANLSGDYRVWTGDAWSLVQTDAMTFDTLDDADEYVKANYARLSGR
jgi:hypothetical protein